MPATLFSLVIWLGDEDRCPYGTICSMCYVVEQHQRVKPKKPNQSRLGLKYYIFKPRPGNGIISESIESNLFGIDSGLWQGSLLLESFKGTASPQAWSVLNFMACRADFHPGLFLARLDSSWRPKDPVFNVVSFEFSRSFIWAVGALQGFSASLNFDRVTIHNSSIGIFS